MVLLLEQSTHSNPSAFRVHKQNPALIEREQGQSPSQIQATCAPPLTCMMLHVIKGSSLYVSEGTISNIGISNGRARTNTDGAQTACTLQTSIPMNTLQKVPHSLVRFLKYGFKLTLGDHLYFAHSPL